MYIYIYLHVFIYIHIIVPAYIEYSKILFRCCTKEKEYIEYLMILLSPSDVFPFPSSLPIHCPCIAPNSEMAMSGRLKGAVNSATPSFWCTHNCSVANKILKRKEFRHAIYFQNQIVAFHLMHVYIFRRFFFSAATMAILQPQNKFRELQGDW